MWKLLKPAQRQPVATVGWQLLAGAAVCVLACDDTPGLVPNFMFDNDRQAAFFFGEPLKVASASGPGSWPTPTSTSHLAVTLAETLLAFAIGSGLGLAGGPVAGAQPHGQRHPGALHQGA
jgi:NitT/TauT family transport system permease protein